MHACKYACTYMYTSNSMHVRGAEQWFRTRRRPGAERLAFARKADIKIDLLDKEHFSRQSPRQACWHGPISDKGDAKEGARRRRACSGGELLGRALRLKGVRRATRGGDVRRAACRMPKMTALRRTSYRWRRARPKTGLGLVC